VDSENPSRGKGGVLTLSKDKLPDSISTGPNDV